MIKERIQEEISEEKKCYILTIVPYEKSSIQHQKFTPAQAQKSKFCYVIETKSPDGLASSTLCKSEDNLYTSLLNEIITMARYRKHYIIKEFDQSKLTKINLESLDPEHIVRAIGEQSKLKVNYENALKYACKIEGD